MSITPQSTALVQRYAPELDQRCRSHLKSSTDCWRVDETYVKVKGTWMYLYRAVDSPGHTMEFQFSASRDTQAAQRFFVKTLDASHTINATCDQRRQKRRLFSSLPGIESVRGRFSGVLATYHIRSK
jgi:transposase-like protein